MSGPPLRGALWLRARIILIDNASSRQFDSREFHRLLTEHRSIMSTAIIRRWTAQKAGPLSKPAPNERAFPNCNLSQWLSSHRLLGFLHLVA